MVKVYDGKTFNTLYQFKAFPESVPQRMHIGTFVASADINNDGYSDMVVGAGAGWMPMVRVFSGQDGSLLHQFLAYDASFRGGVRVAAGDIDKDGFGEIVTGAGRGSLVRAFDGHTYAQILSFDAYQGLPNRDGVFVALGDVEGDSNLDIITGTGPNMGANVRVFNGASGQYVDQIFSDPQLRVGVPLGVFDWDGDGVDEVLVGRGRGRPGRIDVWQFDGNAQHWTDQDHFIAFDNAFGESVS
jgi:hypothetical protein